MSASTPPSTYVYIHSGCIDNGFAAAGGGVCSKNTASSFTNILPSTLYFKEAGWRVALHQLICERPYHASPNDLKYEGDDDSITQEDNFSVQKNIYSPYSFPKSSKGGIINVKLKEVDALFCPDQIICSHVIKLTQENEHSFLSKLSNEKLSDVLNPETHVWEPINKTYYRLGSTTLNRLTVELDSFQRESFSGPAKIYPAWQYVRPSTVVLEFKMFPTAETDLLPLRLSSEPTANYMQNKNNSFRCNVPPLFNNNTGQDWLVALTDISLPSSFTPLPLGHEELFMQFKGEGRDERMNLTRSEINKDTIVMDGHLTSIFRKFIAQCNFLSVKITAGKLVFFKLTSAITGSLSMSQELAAIYGLGKEGQSLEFTERNQTKTLMGNFRLFLPATIYIYADFIQPSPNGNAMSQILGAVPLEKAYLSNEEAGMHTYQPRNLSFFRLLNKNLQTCAVELRDENGQLVNFSNKFKNYVTMTLVIQMLR